MKLYLSVFIFLIQMAINGDSILAKVLFIANIVIIFSIMYSEGREGYDEINN